MLCQGESENFETEKNLLVVWRSCHTHAMAHFVVVAVMK